MIFVYCVLEHTKLPTLLACTQSVYHFFHAPMGPLGDNTIVRIQSVPASWRIEYNVNLPMIDGERERGRERDIYIER